MPKSINQKAKILYLMRILLRETDENHYMSSGKLIERLSEYGICAERKSLYADIEVLRDFGIDVNMRTGRSGGYFVAQRDFQLPELKLLVDSVQSSKFITAKKSEELIEKLSSFASKYEEREIRRCVYVANRVKTVNEQIYYNVDALQFAISDDRQIAFTYYEWTERKEKRLRHDGREYIISPCELTWDDDNYYLLGYEEASGKIKHFRVDKMLSIRILEERRRGREAYRNFDLAVYSKQVFGMFGGEAMTVCLSCENSMAGVIIDQFGSDVPFVNRCDRFEVSVRVFISPLFLSWIAAFGGKIKIVSPEQAVEEFKKLLTASLEAVGK